jgi:aminopeptidase
VSAPDPYVPHRGDSRYRVTRTSWTWTTGRDQRAVRPGGPVRAAAGRPAALSLDLVGLGVDDVRVDGRRPGALPPPRRALVVTLPSRRRGLGAVGAGALLGHPAPQRGPWGEVGWEELTDGVLVAGQPDGAPTWFPCNDHPADKATYRTTVRTESGYSVVANGVLVSQQQGSSRTTWVYEQTEPMATYLATVQIGRYDEHVLARVPVPQLLLAPTRLRERALADTARSPEMLALFTRLFGPYPFAGYTVVVTDDDLEIPLEAQGVSVFGANHVDGAGGSERLVAHELAHQWFGNSLTAERWRTSGCTRASPATRSGCGPRPAAVR